MPPKRGKGKRQGSAQPSAKRFASARVLFPAGMPASQVSRSVKLELKTVDVNNAGSSPFILNINNAGALRLLNGTEQGNDINNRTGRKIAMKSIRLIGTVQQTNSGTAPQNDYVRLMIVYDRQANAASWANSDLLQAKDAAGNTSSTVFDGLNPSNFERFTVIKSERLFFPNYAGLADPILAPGQDYMQRTNIDWFVPLKGLECHYNAANSGTISDIQMGALWFFVMGATAPANFQYSFEGASRLRFLDK